MATKIESKGTQVQRNDNSFSNFSRKKEESPPPIYTPVEATFPSYGRKTVRGKTVAWHLEVAELTADDIWSIKLSGWIIDASNFSDLQGLRLRFGDHELIIAPTIERGDVTKALDIPLENRRRMMKCGIAVTDFYSRSCVVSCSVIFDDDEIDLGEIRRYRSPYVEGASGWLFLSNDSNNSIRQYSEFFSATDKWKSGWDTYFESMSELKDIAERALFIISPSKEEVLSAAYPFKRSVYTPVDALMRRFDLSPASFPVDLLRGELPISYEKGDTHWTDYGANLALENLFRETFDDAPSSSSVAYKVFKGLGDLGIKSTPPRYELSIRASENLDDYKVFDNCALHHGNIRIYENASAPLGKTLVIFGGSSSDCYLAYAVHSFRRVVTCYSAGSVDKRIVENENSPVVLLQTNQRFLINPPAPTVSCVQTAVNKLREGAFSPNAPRDPIERMREYKHPSVAWYVQTHLSVLKEYGHGNEVMYPSSVENSKEREL